VPLRLSDQPIWGRNDAHLCGRALTADDLARDDRPSTGSGRRAASVMSGARYDDPLLSRFTTADSVSDRGPQGLNRYSYALNNPILYRDPTGHFSVYVHTEGAGHVGVQVYEKDYDSDTVSSSGFQRNEKGDLIKNYDFGRYHGTYAGWNIRFYSGPNILKVSSGEPYVLKKHGGTLYRISVSQQLDHLVAHKFKDVFEKGLSQVPDKIKEKMKSQKSLSLNERYMQSDWDLLGPNCVTFSFEILHDALQEVMKGERFSEELRHEAKLTQEKLEEIKSFYPKGVKNQIDK
jgi:RHS repeat-associated protein